MAEKIEFPKWVYAPGRAQIIQNAAEYERIGIGWYESPVDVPSATEPIVPYPVIAEPVLLAVVEDPIAVPATVNRLPRTRRALRGGSGDQ